MRVGLFKAWPAKGKSSERTLDYSWQRPKTQAKHTTRQRSRGWQMPLTYKATKRKETNVSVGTQIAATS